MNRVNFFRICGKRMTLESRHVNIKDSSLEKCFFYPRIMRRRPIFKNNRVGNSGISHRFENRVILYQRRVKNSELVSFRRNIVIGLRGNCLNDLSAWGKCKCSRFAAGEFSFAWQAATFSRVRETKYGAKIVLPRARKVLHLIGTLRTS